MARRLVASDFDVTLWNRTPDRAQALHLGRVAATPADAARDADVIISSLTNEAAIRDVYLGEHGVLRSAAGKLLIEMSTAGPEVIEALDREAQQPVSGARAVGRLSERRHQHRRHGDRHGTARRQGGGQR